jgi:hypothetical protein
MPALNIANLATLASDDQARGDGSVREKCRRQTEKFREEDLENRFNPSLEDFRLAAEGVRRQSEANVPLYRQLLIVYDALSERYQRALEAYKQANRACRITPFPTRPDRT